MMRLFAVLILCCTTPSFAATQAEALAAINAAEQQHGVMVLACSDAETTEGEASEDMDTAWSDYYVWEGYPDASVEADLNVGDTALGYGDDTYNNGINIESDGDEDMDDAYLAYDNEDWDNAKMYADQAKGEYSSATTRYNNATGFYNTAKQKAADAQAGMQ